MPNDQRLTTAESLPIASAVGTVTTTMADAVDDAADATMADADVDGVVDRSPSQNCCDSEQRARYAQLYETIGEPF